MTHPLIKAQATSTEEAGSPGSTENFGRQMAAPIPFCWGPWNPAAGRGDHDCVPLLCQSQPHL